MDNLFRKKQEVSRLLLSIIVVFVVLLNACSIEAKSLKKGEVFRSLDREDWLYKIKGGVIEVISKNELEVTVDGKIILARYDFKGDKLRVVANIKGTEMVVYYLLTEEGLKDEKSGEIYYSKAGLAALEEKRKRAEEEKRKELEKTMVSVKGGCYQMGDTFGDGESNEKPVHEVCVNDYYMGKYEVTQGQWKAIMGNNPSHFKDCGDNCPVENVSWNDIQDFIRKLNEKITPLSKGGSKGGYRLPTEAEWEYAARSGGKSEKYSGGNDIDSVAWYDKNSGSKTHPVGQKAANGLGLYDMSGNVWERVNDWYDNDYYKNSPKDNPRGPGSATHRVLRGGGWDFDAWVTRAAYRLWNNPVIRNDHLGFRLVRTP